MMFFSKKYIFFFVVLIGIGIFAQAQSQNIDGQKLVPRVEVFVSPRV